MFRPLVSAQISRLNKIGENEQFFLFPYIKTNVNFDHLLTFTKYDDYFYYL